MADSTKAQIGSKTTFSYWNLAASPPAWTEFAQVRNSSPVGKKRATVDSTTLDSDAMESVKGLGKGDAFSLVLTTNLANIALIEGFVDGEVDIDVKMTHPAPASYSRYFSINALGVTQQSVTPNGLLELTFDGEITGAIVSTDPHI